MRRRKALPTTAGFLAALMSPAQTVHGTATDRIIALIEEAILGVLPGSVPSSRPRTPGPHSRRRAAG